MVARKEHVVEDGVEKRWCGQCKVYKNLDRFGFSKSTWDKLRPTCKDCLHQYNLDVSESRTEYNKQYWQDTKEEQTVRHKKWVSENPEKVKAGMKKWLEENKEYKKQKDKEYRETHWEEKKAYNRDWQRENYKKLKEDGGEKFAELKIKSNVGRRLREILGQDKSESCIKYTGCSLEKLRIYLESTFKDGMTWENYGSRWHIDHKLPCAAFNHSNPVELMACWHFKNLQALWAAENIIKKDFFSPVQKDRYMKWFIETKM
jgi:hypothetical protein